MTTSASARSPGRRGLVVWLTGRPSSGKTTLAKAAQRALAAKGTFALVLDGDQVRGAITPAHGYDEAGRAAFYSTLANLAALLSAQGAVVLVAATAHRAAFRDTARDRAGAFLEVFVDTPADECAARDDKGLYDRARRGELAGPPGGTYEAPPAPDLVARGGRDGEAIDRLVDRVEEAVA